MQKKENRRVTMTKQLLKDALVSLLEKNDIYNISIRELCEAADVNRSTFYKYYGSQFDLLADMENDLILMVNQAVEDNPAQAEKIVFIICKNIEENIDLCRLLVNNNVDAAFPEKIFSQAIMIQNEIFRRLGNSGTSETEYMYNMLAYGCYQAMRVWINKENRESPEEFAKIIDKIISKLG
ncbi:MAG: TetR/AcrR family transcriptional regulator [Clostridiales bacterium]|jgi:AcrR family transcriptional regulator|nr:TetR/AcrR family transcriptional regulator [Clostridiales bacterium]